LLALLGILVALTPVHHKRLVAIGGLSIYYSLGAIEFFRTRNYLQLIRASASEAALLVGYVVFCIICLFVALSHPRLPDNLPDGAYVSKEPTRGVIIQYITGNLPTDNALPLVVAEYFLHNISFRENHPIMPGQEVVNRPVLAALVTTPIIAAVAPPFSEINTIPTFNYVGTQWPDFRVLVRDARVYAIYLSVMIALNAALLLGAAFAISSAASLNFKATISAVALFASSPYLIFQTIFTWPKELAAFFVLIGFGLLLSKRSALLIGSLLGFAFLSHPYAEAFLVGFVIYFFFEKDLINSITSSIALAIGFLIITAPWIFWSHSLHLSSDLVTQNLFIPGQRHIDFIWIRLVNLLNTILPSHLQSPNFDVTATILGSTLNIAGAVGIIIYAMSIYLLGDFAKSNHGKVAIFAIAIPSCLLIFVFSNQAVPALHGLQVAIPLIIFCVTIWLSCRSDFIGTITVPIQTLLNITLLTAYFIKIGVI